MYELAKVRNSTRRKPLECTCPGCYERFDTHEQYIAHLNEEHGSGGLDDGYYDPYETE